MPVVPDPIGPPELMPFLRWVRETLLAVIQDAQRKGQSDSNLNASQNSTMDMLVARLGEVQAGIDDMISLATFNAAQITSGLLDVARLPGHPADLLTSGTLNIPGNITTAGHVYVPNSTLASFGSWTVAYIDGDGRLTRGASSARFKVDIVKAPDTGDLFAVDLKEFAMKDGNGWRVLGYIAEDLVGTDMERFVVWEREADEDGEFHTVRDEEGNPVPLSIDFIPMLIAQNADLHRRLEATAVRLEELTMRVEALEGK